jgi:type IV secretion system protein VirB1
MLTTIAALALTCAPNIHPATLSALVQHESSANQYAIGVNDPAHRLSHQPSSLDRAVSVARALIADGVNFDAGLGQINVRNWGWLGLTAETVFDPCTNLTAAQTVLSECYARALKTHRPTQQALRAALSCYNTGDLTRGFKNGYVGRVLAAAGIQVPALQADSVTAGEAPPPKPPTGSPDGFSSNPIPDGFSQPPPAQEQTAPAA